jgi:hypothetical protein
MKKYYIYHIEGVKIGCSTQPNKRVNNQGYSEYTILETYDDIITASIRERELQKEYGYKVDSSDYYKQMKMVNAASKPSIRKKAIKNTNQKERAIKAIETCNKLNWHWNKEGKKNMPVLQYDKNGNFIKEYASIKLASECIGVSKGFITMVCKGKRKTAKGFTFNYKNKV